jgi:hypothetical protein
MSQPMPNTGPYVAVATLCERHLLESDNVISIMRVVDRLTITAAGENAPEELPAFPIGLTAIIILRRGETRGRHALKIRPEDPSGRQHDSTTVSVLFTGDPEAGVNVIIDLNQFGVDQVGLWWFDVLFGDAETLLSRIPLRIDYVAQRASPPQ